METPTDLEAKCHYKLEQGSSSYDFVQAKKKIFRAPQIIRQTLNVGPQTHDEAFEQINKRFREIYCGVATLIDNCDKYCLAIDSFVQHSIKISETFDLIIGDSRWDAVPSINSTESIGTSPKSPLEQHNKRLAGEYYSSLDGIQGISKDRAFNIARFSNRLKSVGSKVSSDLQLLQTNVKSPMLKIMNICKNIERSITGRYLIVTDLNRYMNKLENLERKGNSNLSPRQEENRVKHERNAEIERMKYDSVNATLKVELRLFFKLFQEFMDNWFPNYYYTTYTISYTLYNFLGNCPEVRKMITTETNNTGLESPIEFCIQPSEDLIKNFHHSFDIVTEYLENFEIINFNRFYQHSIQNANASTELQFRDNAANGTVPTVYATALYDYSPDPNQQGTGEDLTFKNGDMIRVIKKTENNWWYGEVLRTKRRGYFPVNFVETERYL